MTRRTTPSSRIHRPTGARGLRLRYHWWWPDSNFGMVMAAALFLIGTSPSLLPRPWWALGIIGGVMTALGYIIGKGIGLFMLWLVRLAGLEVSAKPGAIRAGWITLYILGAGTVLFLTTQSASVSREQAALVGMAQNSWLGIGAGIVIAIVIAVGLFFAGLGLRAIFGQMWAWIGRWLPQVLAKLIAATVLTITVAALIQYGLVGTGFHYLTKLAYNNDRSAPAGIEKPYSPYRSGSALSAQDWDTIGLQGKYFLGRGPNSTRIAAAMGGVAREPVRIYTSRNQHPTIPDAVTAAVTEMENLGAFDRQVIVVATATGTGWLDEWNTQAVEYLTRGDCATVAIQYSYLPSAVSFLTDRSEVAEAGAELYRAVRERIAKIPSQRRPRLYVTGESLGAHGSQAPFTTAAEAIAGVDGAVWIGPPEFSPLRRNLTRLRNPGSPEVAPVYRGGEHIRFATSPRDLDADIYGRAYGEWEFPRLVYIQHPSDPVVWWSPQLIFHEPDWVREAAGRDVTSRLQWWPLVTFFQVSADLPTGGHAPSGHGHTYREELIPAWARVLGRPENEIEPALASIRANWWRQD